jgi:hypothetical protein
MEALIERERELRVLADLLDDVSDYGAAPFRRTRGTTIVTPPLTRRAWSYLALISGVGSAVLLCGRPLSRPHAGEECVDNASCA